MCGFVGIIGRQDCAADILLGLQALQHRGQDAAGVGTVDQDSFPIKRRSGLVAQNFGPEEIGQLPGAAGIGHVRYPTLGSQTLRDAQPFFYRQPGVLMAHNGNFISVRKMQEYLADESVHLMSRCDMEPMLCIFSLELMRIRRKNHTSGRPCPKAKPKGQVCPGLKTQQAHLPATASRPQLRLLPTPRASFSTKSSPPP